LIKAQILSHRDNRGATPLSSLAYGYGANSEAIVNLLIERGADIEARDNEGLTPLAVAAKHGLLELADIFLKKGADIYSVDNNGRTPPSWVGWSAHNYREVSGSSVPMAVANVPVANLLIEKGADIESRDNSALTPLAFAARGSALDVVSLLLEKGAAVNSADNHGRTPLSHAAISGWEDTEATINLLIDKGAGINCRDNKRRTPLAILRLRIRELEETAEDWKKPGIDNFEEKYKLRREWDVSPGVEQLLIKRGGTM
jgi:ankyrin repeat protein